MKETSELWGDSNNVHACMRVLESGKKNVVWSDGRRPLNTKNNKHEWMPLFGEWEPSQKEKVTLGLLLDLDEGALAVYENGRNLGILKSGLTGSYCWRVEIFDIADGKRLRLTFFSLLLYDTMTGQTNSTLQYFRHIRPHEERSRTSK